MKAVIQRVLSAAVEAEGERIASVGRGFLLLLGVTAEDDEAAADRLAKKAAELRIFEDETGRMNRSVRDIDGSALVVSNFTLYADTKKGRRPGFTRAAKPPVSVDCYNEFVAQMKSTRLAGVQTGEFGAEMHISLVNEGPITIVIDTDEWAAKGE